MAIKLLNSLHKLSETISTLQEKVDSFDYEILLQNIANLSNSDKLIKLEQLQLLKKDSLEHLQQTSTEILRETNEKEKKLT